jgi:hypothetical protein
MMTLIQARGGYLVLLIDATAEEATLWTDSYYAEYHRAIPYEAGRDLAEVFKGNGGTEGEPCE